jgi:hypothetical protein
MKETDDHAEGVRFPTINATRSRLQIVFHLEIPSLVQQFPFIKFYVHDEILPRSEISANPNDPG